MSSLQQEIQIINAESNNFINGELILKDIEGKIAEFVPFEVDNNYEILTVCSYTIRRKDNHEKIIYNYDLRYKAHYMTVLNGKIYLRDQIIEKSVL